MSQLSPEARRLLQLARRDDAPDQALQRRVERSLGRRVALGAALSTGGALVTKTAAGARILVLAAKIVGASSVVVGGGWLVNQSLSPASSRGSEAPPSSPVRETKRASRASSEAAVEAPPAPALPIADVGSDQGPRALPAPKKAQLEATAEPAAPAVTGFPASPAPDRLLLETNDLRRAQQALRAGDPALALRLVHEQDQAHVAGVLQQERAAVSVFALCESGQVAKARSEAAKFEQRWPESALAARVRASCRDR